MYCVRKKCSFCGAGCLAYVLCSDKKTLVIVCDECESTWLNAHDIGSTIPVDVAPPDFMVPGLSCSIAFPVARWATRKDLVNAGLDISVLEYIEGP